MQPKFSSFVPTHHNSSRRRFHQPPHVRCLLPNKPTTFKINRPDGFCTIAISPTIPRNTFPGATQFVYNRIRWHFGEDNKNKTIKANPLLSADSTCFPLFILFQTSPRLIADIILNNTFLRNIPDLTG